MYKTLQSYVVMALMLLAMPLYAAEPAPEPLTIVTLKNGTTVKLNDDFTWEYVFITPEVNEAVTDAVPSTPPTNDVATTAVIGSAPAIQATGPEVAGTLTAGAMAQSALLKSTAKGGVKISYLNCRWDKEGRLGLNFELSSTSSENYVMIELEIGLFGDSGQLLKRETADVWQAIFRMPETYLRKGQTRNSETLWIEGIDKSQWEQQLMTLKIKEMSSR